MLTEKKSLCIKFDLDLSYKMNESNLRQFLAFSTLLEDETIYQIIYLARICIEKKIKKILL